MDDIVERLRTVIATPHGVDIWTTTALEAADEIERLEKLLQRCYRLAVGHGFDSEVFESWEDAIDAYEARHA